MANVVCSDAPRTVPVVAAPSVGAVPVPNRRATKHLSFVSVFATEPFTINKTVPVFVGVIAPARPSITAVTLEFPLAGFDGAAVPPEVAKLHVEPRVQVTPLTVVLGFASLVFVTAAEPIVVAHEPADVVTSPVNAGVCPQASELAILENANGDPPI